ncbi:MAG TPA: hypothetical protein VJ861_07930 [Treponemataceae bacterium]|nr:hypothetical protein [Treponemataceae bacterium]
MNLQSEIIYFFVYDAGRSIDLSKAAKLIPASTEPWIIRNRRDTPQSLSLPHPLIVQLAKIICPPEHPFETITLTARIFEDGVISMNALVTGSFLLEQLHKIRYTAFYVNDTETTIDTWVDASMQLFFNEIQEAITFEQYVFSAFIRQCYTVFCLTTPIPKPQTFVQENREIIACLLNGEQLNTRLHESQIEATLRGAFCYTEHDFAVFDLDRCLIIDPERDYQDILLVIEQVICQLVALRSLDTLLDRWLDKAENDIKIIFKHNSARLKLLKVKLANIQALTFDALFILENLENSSKIIGDYFLGQIFNNLCQQLNTDGWKLSIERRLKTLESVYRRLSEHDSERRMVFLEVMFIIVCVLFPVFQMLQTFFLAR